MNYPESMAQVTWNKDDLQFSLVRSHMGHYCGYVRFATRPLIEEGYNGIATYVPVHGGLTYAERDSDGMVYGFDCAHSGDESRSELWDVDWLRSECERMGLAIKTVATFEQQFLLARDSEERANIIQQYHDTLEQHGIMFNLTDNFGAMINVLLGGL